jgi:hypothetical protein
MPNPVEPPARNPLYSDEYSEVMFGAAPMDSETQSLTTCEVASDGGGISLNFVGPGGEPQTIRLSLNQVGALAMTLPGLIDKALQTRYGDRSLRYTFPLESWIVEQSSDPRQSMITLRTADGFSVCFSMQHALQSELGEALVSQYAPRAFQPN